MLVWWLFHRRQNLWDDMVTVVCVLRYVKFVGTKVGPVLGGLRVCLGVCSATRGSVEEEEGEKKRSISVLLRNFESRLKVGILPRATHSQREYLSSSWRYTIPFETSPGAYDQNQQAR